MGPFRKVDYGPLNKSLIWRTQLTKAAIKLVSRAKPAYYFRPKRRSMLSNSSVQAGSINILFWYFGQDLNVYYETRSSNTMRKHLLRITCLALMATMFTPVMGQDIEEQIRDLAKDNAEGYLGAFPSLFGTAMNTGVFRTAKPHKLLGFDVTFNAMLVGIPDEAKTFDFVLPGEFDIPIGETGQFVTLDGTALYEGEDLEVPTFFGSNDVHTISPNQTYLSNQVETAIGIPPTSGMLDTLSTLLTYGLQGIDLPVIPMFVPQFSLGLIKDIEVTFGGFSTDVEGNEFSFSRYGAKIGINQFIPTIPLVFPAFSVGYYATSLKAGDVLDANNSILSLQASKSVPVFTLFGGFGIEKSTIDVKVEDPESGEDLLNFSLEGENGFRTTIGFRMKLLLLSINYDYNMGKYSTHNIGLGITFR
jgi:hypothetical protein